VFFIDNYLHKNNNLCCFYFPTYSNYIKNDLLYKYTPQCVQVTKLLHDPLRLDFTPKKLHFHSVVFAKRGLEPR
jgi:hypothetical protein